MAADVGMRVRPLGPEEGLLAAALHVQSLRAAGATTPPGHLDRFAEVWTLSGGALPAWVAEAGGRHAGVTMLQVLPALPPQLATGPAWARLVLLYAVDAASPEAVSGSLLRAAVAWAGERGLPGVEVADGVDVPPAVLDGLGARVEQRRRVLFAAHR